MDVAEVLNQLGLVAGFLGSLILFKWGPPQPELSEGVGLGLEDGTPLSDGRTVAEHNQEIRKLRRRHDWWSRAGLALVALAFLFQLVATRIDSR